MGEGLQEHGALALAHASTALAQGVQVRVALPEDELLDGTGRLPELIDEAIDPGDLLVGGAEAVGGAGDLADGVQAEGDASVAAPAAARGGLEGHEGADGFDLAALLEGGEGGGDDVQVE